MSLTYTIGPNGPISGSAGTAIFQPGRRHGLVSIYNTGSATVYLDNENQQVDPTDGIPLTAGSSIPWDEDLPLYAACPTQTTIVVSSNTAIPFDSGAIAAQIIDQGLAQQIADAIKITGAPPIDNFQLLLSTGLIGTSYVSAVLDVSSFQSLSLTFSNGFPSDYAAGTIAIGWYNENANPASPSTNRLGVDTFYVGTGGFTEASFPVRGSRAIIFAQASSGTGQIRAYASYKTIARPYYFGGGAGSADGLLEGQPIGPLSSGHAGGSVWSGNIPLGDTWGWQPNITAGPAKLTLRVTNTSSMSFIVRVPTTIFSLATIVAVAGATVAGQTDVYDLLFPAMPLEVIMQNTHGTNTLNFRATITSAAPFN